VLHFATNGYKAISSRINYIGKYININIIENERFCVLYQYINQFHRINLGDTLLGVYHFLDMRMASIFSSLSLREEESESAEHISDLGFTHRGDELWIIQGESADRLTNPPTSGA
jgi:hypothetical protein